MKKYADKLLKYYDEHPDFIQPEYRKTEMINNFIKPGLEDLCVTRTTFDWGIKVKSDPKHVIYVWLDALTNYLTALGYMQDDNILANILNGTRFAITKKILVHNWIMMKDGKMSKSKGNVVYPEKLINRYGLYTPETFVERYNFDLCNDLGKLVNRTHPWELAKNEEKEKLASSMYHLIENIRKMGIILLPFMEETAKNLLNQIGVPEELQTWESLLKYEGLKEIKVIEKGEPLFMRKIMEEELEYLRN